MKALRSLVILLLALAAGNSLAGSLVIFHTSLGDMEVELYDKDKPITVQNFLRYVKGGYYQNNFFHRCPTGSGGYTDFVVQGGEFDVVNINGTNKVAAVPNFPPIPDEFATGTRYSNVYGTLAMAKLGGDTNSATSSWFFNLADNSFLDAADTNDLFTVFGHVVRGTNVLNQFIGRFYNYGLQDLSASLSSYYPTNIAPAFTSVPVNFAGAGPTSFANLYFVNISILTPQLKLLTNGARQISWNSINGLTNALEYATNLPPVWQTLTNVVGTGASVTNLDSSTNQTGRFYRVQILY